MKRYGKSERGGGLFSAMEQEQAVAAKTTGICKLGGLIPRESFPALLGDVPNPLTNLQPSPVKQG